MKKIILATVAVAMTIGVFAFGQKEKKSRAKEETLINYQFRFDSQLLSDADDPAKYTQVAPNQLPTCQGSDLPCRIDFTSTNSNPIAALTAHLATFEDEEEILANAAAKRDVQ